jgi:hypothetical protein
MHSHSSLHHTLTHPHTPSHTLTHPHTPSHTLTHPHTPSHTLTHPDPRPSPPTQGKQELKEHLRKLGSKDYRDKLSDLHLLLWLSRQPNLDPHDMEIICEAIHHKKPMPEGYRFIIDSLAGL